MLPAAHPGAKYGYNFGFIDEEHVLPTWVNPDREIYRSPLVQFVQVVVDLRDPLPPSAHEQLLISVQDTLPGGSLQFGAGYRHGPTGPDPMLFALASNGDGVVVFAHAVIVESVRYERFERFIDHVERSVGAIDLVPGAEAASVTLRYVDEIRIDVKDPNLEDFAPYVGFALRPHGSLGQKATHGSGSWSLSNDDGLVVDLEWGLTDSEAVSPSHPLAGWYTAPARRVLVLDWTCRVEISPAFPDVRCAASAAHNAIKNCFDDTITDACRELMRKGDQ